ncbi:MAG TPA: tRNA lysidine(34) synthetase TilS [Candidatus Acidoferrales bacterium]|nr:tRNA lysidine(34) synthetase TilS [Candidatus Acidoferrales bacterium]
MAESLIQRVAETICRHRMTAPGAHVGIGVSGGADSVALSLVLKELRDTLGIRLAAIHFNHQLRGEEADRDEQFVRKLAAALECEFIGGSENVAACAQEHAWNLEDAGRRLRYQFFADLVRDRRVTQVAVAHTADDQAETVLAQIIRGTGPTGLAGIYPVAENVIRPFLEVRRAELRDFLTARGQAWCEDSTNQDETRLRARIRNRLIPSLETSFQPAITGHLARLASLAREDECFWQHFIEEKFHRLARFDGGTVRVVTADLLAPMGRLAHGAQEVNTAVSTRLVRRILEEVKGSRRGFNQCHIQDVIALAQTSQSGSRLELPAGIVVEKTFGELCFWRDAREGKHAQTLTSKRRDFRYEVALQGLSDLAVDVTETGRRLRLKVIDWSTRQRDTYPYALDLDLLRTPLELRNWQPGDAYRPQGRLHQRKLKHLLRERRVALRERANWPVLTSAGSVAWTRGFPFAADFVANSRTRLGVLVIEEPL